MVGSSSVVGVSSMIQRQAPVLSLYPVSIGDPSWSYMMTFCFVKVTLHSSSHMRARPMRVCWKNGINLTDRGKSGDRFGRHKSEAPLNWCGWPLAVPTVILGAVGSNLIFGACFEK